MLPQKIAVQTVVAKTGKGTQPRTPVQRTKDSADQ